MRCKQCGWPTCEDCKVRAVGWDASILEEKGLILYSVVRVPNSGPLETDSLPMRIDVSYAFDGDGYEYKGTLIPLWAHKPNTAVASMIPEICAVYRSGNIDKYNKLLAAVDILRDS